MPFPKSLLKMEVEARTLNMVAGCALGLFSLLPTQFVYKSILSLNAHRAHDQVSASLMLIPVLVTVVLGFFSLKGYLGNGRYSLADLREVIETCGAGIFFEMSCIVLGPQAIWTAYCLFCFM